MSLIVAKKVENYIYIVSDTRLDYPDTKFPEKKLANPGEGVIKTTIINPLIAISFAGVNEEGRKAIRACRLLAMTIMQWQTIF